MGESDVSNCTRYCLFIYMKKLDLWENSLYDNVEQ